MTIFVCITVGLQEDGVFTLVKTDAAFQDKDKAEAFFKDKVRNFKEVVEGVTYDCTRAIHEVELNQ